MEAAEEESSAVFFTEFMFVRAELSSSVTS